MLAPSEIMRVLLATGAASANGIIKKVAASKPIRISWKSAACRRSIGFLRGSLFNQHRSLFHIVQPLVFLALVMGGARHPCCAASSRSNQSAIATGYLLRLLKARAAYLNLPVARMH